MENTKLSKMTVGQYQLLNAIDDTLPVMEQNIYAVAAIKDMTYDEASKIKLRDFSIMIGDLGEFNIKLLEGLKINSKVMLGGQLYHIEHKPDNLTSGQLLDVINIRSKHAGEGVKVMDLLLAAISKPNGKNYGDDNLNINERAALMRGAELQSVWNIFVFFWNLWNDYLSSTEDSLEKWMQETLTMSKEILDKDGDSLA
jgi:hypothetical protein|tara:strand:+ start:635 stop:1231 length:597 start_codon:yes stop_codon:yes gene_type:complete